MQAATAALSSTTTLSIGRSCVSSKARSQTRRAPSEVAMLVMAGSSIRHPAAIDAANDAAPRVSTATMGVSAKPLRSSPSATPHRRPPTPY